MNALFEQLGERFGLGLARGLLRELAGAPPSPTPAPPLPLQAKPRRRRARVRLEDLVVTQTRRQRTQTSERPPQESTLVVAEAVPATSLERYRGRGRCPKCARFDQSLFQNPDGPGIGCRDCVGTSPEDT